MLSRRRLGDHDRVIDQQADPERQSSQRQDIHRHVQTLQQHQRDQHRQRDHQTDRHREPPVAQEDQHHDERQRAAQDDLLSQVREGVHDEVRLFRHHVQRDAREFRLQLLYDSLEFLRDRDCVGARVLVDHQADRRLAIETRQSQRIGSRDHDRGQVTQLDAASRRADGGVADLEGCAELRQRADGEAELPPPDRPRRSRDVRRADGIGDVVARDVEPPHPGRIHLDAYLVGGRADDGHACHATDLL